MIRYFINKILNLEPTRKLFFIISALLISPSEKKANVSFKNVSYEDLSWLTSQNRIDKNNLFGIKGTSFEEPDIYSKWAKIERAFNYSIMQSDSIFYNGTHSCRFELRKNDPIVENGKRAELIWNYEKIMNIHRWYSFNIFLPNSYANDSIPETLAQWHDNHDAILGELPRSPALSLNTENGKWHFFLRWSSKVVNTNQNIDGYKIFDLGNIINDRWAAWVFEIKFSYKSDGILRIWHNNKLVVEHYGPNYYNDVKGPFFKIGIYKPHWNNALKDFKITRRIVYFDNIKIGDQSTTFKQLKIWSPIL